MKKLKVLSLLCAAATSFFVLTSAISKNNADAPAAATTATTVAVENNAAAAHTMSYSELKQIFTAAQGGHITFKEKLALRLFHKKIAKHLSENGGTGKSQVVALVLVLLAGGLGIHRFYLGYTWQGIVQLLTAGGCGIWAFIDMIRIFTGSLQPKDGSYDQTL